MNFTRIIQDKLISWLLLLMGIIYLAETQQMSMGTLKSPGEGLVPFLSGTLLVLLTVMEISRRKMVFTDPLPADAVLRVMLLLAALAGYLTLLPLLGFKLTTFLSVFVTGRIFANKNWSGNLLFSFLAVLLTSLVFQSWLQLPLPEIIGW